MDLLTKGSIQSITEGTIVKHPILKVVNLKLLPSDTPKRYRLHLTDGITSLTYVMLATQLNEKIDSGELKRDSIIRLDSYTLKHQDNKKILVLLELTVIDNAQVGDMTNVETKSVTNPTSKLTTRVATDQFGSGKSIPINLINNYQNKWRIEGRVTQKAPMKTYNNPRGEGKLFNFIICDATCDIKITAFNNEANKYYDMIQIGKAFSLSKGMVKVANATYNNTKCDYEITLISDSEIVEIADRHELPQMLFDFVQIDKIAERQPDTFIDVVGVAHSIMDTATISSKTTNKDIRKRDVILVDRSGSSIKLTLWSDSVDLLDNQVNPVIVVKGASVKEFNGRTLSSGFNATILINPTDIPEAMALVGWYDEFGASSHFQGQQGSSGSIQSGTKFTHISKLACDSDSDKAEYYMVSATISQIKYENLVYKACSSDKCNKKLVDQNNGLYRCEKCNTESPDFNYRLIMNMYIIDFTHACWVTCFQEVAERILGKSASEIGTMVELEQKDEMNNMFKRALMKSVQLKLRVKNETYNDETRMKVTVAEGKERDCIEEITRLLSMIKSNE